MASLSRSLIKSLNISSKVSTSKKLLNISFPHQLNSRNYARQVAEHVIRFKVEPRQPITDLVSHDLVYKDSDPVPYFNNKKVQNLLTELTGNDPEKVHRHRKYKNIDAPQFQFLTTDQLQNAHARAERKARKVLMMPPILKVREDSEEVIQKDPALQGLMTDKLVVTDISANVSDAKRVIVVREPDGTLHHANMEQRHRMNTIYNPREGRTLHMPSLFSMKRLKAVLEEREYEFLLDRACLQMEPYEHTFQSTQAVTFSAIDANGDYDRLLSTRHYGPMVFFLVWNRRIDGLLEHLVKSEKLAEVAKVLEVFSTLHPESSVALAQEREAEDILTTYIKEESKSGSSLELALKVYKDIQRTKQEYEENVIKAHGGQTSS